MEETFEKLQGEGYKGTYCEFEELLLANAKDIIDALQVGGRPAARDKRCCK